MPDFKILFGLTAGFALALTCVVAGADGSGIAPRPLYRDPVFDGAADPVVIWNPSTARWWMNSMHWSAQPEDLLGRPGTGADDGVNGGHAGAVVNAGRAFCFYFTHPRRAGTIKPGDLAALELRRSSIQVVELVERNGALTCDRNHLVALALQPPAPSRAMP